MIQLSAVSQRPEGLVADYVRALAGAHGVTYKPTAYDAFAETASRLVGDDLPPADETQDLLIALYRAKVITDQERNDLLVRHLRQTRA
ncbi:hypothetical protein [Microvirga puerhi]|uniref:Uncharacterized protein n=1 Tax=Microvirga puerhi TaxID=2876078 RepID=A0ABS7VUR4_9HYPH|nr:hypothetical protein [Microvirga puerhi]MBZ6078886.1 hypothetical protein [Microvirga puerhi]